MNLGFYVPRADCNFINARSNALLEGGRGMFQELKTKSLETFIISICNITKKNTKYFVLITNYLNNENNKQNYSANFPNNAAFVL